MQVLGVLVAFAGSVCIIKPSFQNPAMLPALAGMLGGMGAGIAYTFVRRLGKKNENSKRIVFWFSAFSCLFCLPFLLFTYEPMRARQLLYLILAGTCLHRTARHHQGVCLRACQGNLGLRLRAGAVCGDSRICRLRR